MTESARSSATTSSTSEEQPSTLAGACARHGVTRRGALAGIAGVGGACLLAACGSSDETASGGSSGSGDGSSSAGSGDSSGDASGGGDGSGVPVADVAVGGGVIVGDAPEPFVVTQPSEGEFKAFSAICTHQSCTVTSVSSGEILCSCHGSRFDAANGEVLQGPATQPLSEYTVSRDGDTLSVQA